VRENYLEKQKKVFVAFMDDNQSGQYDRVDSMAMWEVLGMFGVVGKMLCAIKSRYV
jgi:hypothetical protein